MALPIEHRRHVTVAEFETYTRDHPDARVELIDGVIHDVSPLSILHLRTVTAIHDHLKGRFPEALVFPGGASIRLDTGSLWEPDVFVVDDLAEDGYIDAGDVLLAVEVAVTSLEKDTGPKLLGYARNAVPEYWVVDPKRGGVFHRFTDPHLGGYATIETTPLPDGIDSLPF